MAKSEALLAEHVLEILRCPKSLGKLIFFPEGSGGRTEPFLFCAKSKLCYRIEEGIAVMLIDEAEEVDKVTCAELKKSAAELGLT